jgi:hypothetical protein
MSIPRKTNRPQAMVKRASRPPRDLRAEKSMPGAVAEPPPSRRPPPPSNRAAARVEHATKKTAPSLRIDPVVVRRVAQEAEIARIKAERASDADDLASMLVSLAEAERNRRDAEGHADDLEKRVKELDGKLELAVARSDEATLASAALRKELQAGRAELSQKATTLDLVKDRARLAEQSFADAAAALERANAELLSEREHVRELQNEQKSAERNANEKLEQANASTSTARAEVALAEATVARLTRVNADLQADRERKQDLEAELARTKKDAATKLEGAMHEAEKGRSEVAACHLKIAHLTRANSELQIARVRKVALEAELVKTQNDAAAELVKLRNEALAELSHTKIDAATKLQQAMDATATAERETAAVDAKLMRFEDVKAKAAEALLEMGKQEATAAAARARSLDQVKRLLGGEEGTDPKGGPASKRPSRL